MKNLSSMRREYGSNELLEQNVARDPFKQFAIWFEEASAANLLDANTMVLATVDKKGYPDTRVVLLKEFSERGFVFFTHYDSPKGVQLDNKNIGALNFYWREFARQIRVRGEVERIARTDSEAYFASRPRESQIGALASHQSTVLNNRAELEKRVAELTTKFAGKSIPCPADWGGYCVMPFEFEFFQGRDNRLNDRIHFLKVNGQWQMDRLSP